MTKLLIVESPGKLKTLRKILGSGWLLEASVGHTTELASDGPKRWGFDLEGERVITRYVPRGSRGKDVLRKLKAASSKADTVYLATDPDREGEAIAWHLVDQLGLKNYRRVTYTQITDAAVKKAIANPRGLDHALIEAQKARQCLDKLVGFEVSPLLWGSTGGKSAGRVQSATLHLICERERERLAFKAEKFWVLTSVYGEGFEAVYEPKTQDVAPTDSRPEPAEHARERVRSRDEAALIAEVARSSPHIVRDCASREERRNPPPPFITSSLQQSAGGRLRFSPKHTMKVAQELYEGVNGKALITYMRTDAVTLSPEFVGEARDWLKSSRPELLPERAPIFRANADSQGAHEAIRPISVSITPDEAERFLSKDQAGLYRMIWERAVASQCKPATLSKTKIEVDAGDTRWVAHGTVVVDEGYLAFWQNLEEDKRLPVVKVGSRLDFKDVRTDERETQPPPRYSEPKLVQLMEKKGIGRPSTFASTIATLKEREYVVLEKSALAPTPLGMSTDEALVKAIPDLVDTEFTATMEGSLDRIAEGKLQWEKYLNAWNRDWFAPAVAKAREVLGVREGARPAFKRGAGGGGGGKGSRYGKGASASGERKPPSAAAQKKLERAKAGVAPVCATHGAMEARLSKKGAPYWKCAAKDCENFAWNVELAREKCPECSNAMEKIPSRKVTGGYFLKCKCKDIVMFRDRKTNEWERARK